NFTAHGEGLGRNDVALLAIGIEQQGNARAAIRIILDCRHFSRDIELVAPEIDDAIALFVPPADVAGGDAPVIVTSAAAGFLRQQRLLGSLLGDLLEVVDVHAASTGGNRIVFFGTHINPSVEVGNLSSFRSKQLKRLGA